VEKGGLRSTEKRSLLVNNSDWTVAVFRKV
jgi:hypothetical protein